MTLPAALQRLRLAGRRPAGEVLERTYERLLLPGATLAGVGLLVWLALPTVWWSPLNVDEELTLRLAQFSFGDIFHIVSTQRGGGPLHFWLERFLLEQWSGLPALRVPSLVFACLALAGVALVARRLIGAPGAAAVVVLTAASPVPVLYATFGRPHTMLFAWITWSTVATLRAADGGGRGWWIAGGFLLGASVFVHPTAPLYALTAFAAAVLYAPAPLRAVVRDAWAGLAALLVTFVPYYVETLHVLGDRYGVGGPAHGRTFSGRPVWEDALRFVAPGGHDLNVFTALAALGAAALAFGRRRRTLAFCALMVAAPVVFFTVVPASGTSALFFDRYMIPATPAFLTAAVAGCLTIAGRAGRFEWPVLALLVAALLAVELRSARDHRNLVHRVDVDAIVHAAERLPHGTVLFGSTGTRGAQWSSFDYGHPPTILDHLVALRVRSLALVDDDSCRRVLPFLDGPRTPRLGAWLFVAAEPEQLARASHAFAGVRGVTAATGAGRYSLVRSRGPVPPRALLRLGRELRLRWKRAVPENARVDELLRADDQLLSRPRTCAPYGDLGDPDISPHWPPLRGPHR